MTRQNVPFAAFLAASVAFFWANFAAAQVNDSLDTYPPRWNLASSDCGAETITSTNLPTGGIGDSGCESVKLNCGHGTEAVLEYRIEPARIIDELTAIVHVRSNSTGQRIGLRVRFPYLLDPQTRQTAAVILYGAPYRETGQWQRIGVGAITAPLRLKLIALRREHGASANLDDAFVDAVVLNAYTGAGENQMSIDNVSVSGIVAANANASLFAARSAKAPTAGPLLAEVNADFTVAMPTTRVSRILQHQGEPLDWVRTLGFDTVLISRPADEAILREAMLARVSIIAPPPSSPDIALEPLLNPLIAYYLGTSLNEANVETIKATSDRVRRFPDRWRRPVVLAPAESWRTYAASSDAIIFDTAPPIRGLAAEEEVASLDDLIARVGRAVPVIVGIRTDPPQALVNQLIAISASIGAPRGDDVAWHAMHLQVIRAMQSGPRAILFRSSRSLTSGQPEDQRRSMALSYINRHLEAIGPVVAGSTSRDVLKCEGADFRCSQLVFPGGELLLASTTRQQRGTVLAGDGDTLRIKLPPSDATKLAWRLTHFSAERMSIQSGSSGPYLEIISPDVVETIILSAEAEMGGRIANVVKRVAGQAALDRWQLTRESLDQLSTDWQAASASRIVNVSRPSIDLLNAAESTLRDAEPTFRSGDPSSAIRMARRADAWQLKSRWNLQAALSPGGIAALNSIPPLLSTGGTAIQLMWSPLMGEKGWGENRLVAGTLDDLYLLSSPGGWTVLKRSELATTSDVRIDNQRHTEGSGCLVATVASKTNTPLAGGYAGTTIQLRSPATRFAANVPVRIDAKIRTLGFGGPDQGVLVYDTIGGSELGILVRNAPTWQPIHLYRQTLAESDVEVMFEAIGAGEVMIDDVRVHAWDPAASQTVPMRRIADANETDATKR